MELVCEERESRFKGLGKKWLYLLLVQSEVGHRAVWVYLIVLRGNQDSS